MPRVVVDVLAEEIRTDRAYHNTRRFHFEVRYYRHEER